MFSDPERKLKQKMMWNTPQEILHKNTLLTHKNIHVESKAHRCHQQTVCMHSSIIITGETPSVCNICFKGFTKNLTHDYTLMKKLTVMRKVINVRFVRDTIRRRIHWRSMWLFMMNQNIHVLSVENVFIEITLWK